MGIIVFDFGTDIKVVAQGGVYSMFKYFISAIDGLVSLARLLDGTVHFIMLDAEAWELYQGKGVEYLQSRVLELEVS